MHTIEEGKMTKDLAMLVGRDTPFLTTEEFLAALDDNLRKAMNSIKTIYPNGPWRVLRAR